MDAADITPSRLVMARYKIADILKQRKDGQTALIVYAGDAFTVTPLTNDTDTIDNQLAALTTSIMPVDGDNLSVALEKAKQLFAQAGLQKGQILLLTDGGQTDDALAGANSLDTYQLLVLGVGTPDGAPIALDAGGFLKDDQGNILVDKLNVGSLEKLAQSGNGAYQQITQDDSDIKNLLATAHLQVHEKGEKNENLLLDQWRDKGPWLLLLVLPLAALCFRKGLLTIAFILLVPLPKNSYALDANKVWQDLWQTKDQQAQQAYQQGDYTKAAELFDNPDWKAAAHYKSGAFDKALENLKNNPNANSLYNQGNALAQSGQLKEALDAYKQALKLNPDDADTKYNKELVEKELEKQQQQNKDDQQDTKKNQEQDKNGSKSEQTDQDKTQDKNKDKEDQGNQKPEQKPEQSQESTENQADKKESAEKDKQENKPETAEADPSKQPEPKKDDKTPEANAAQPLDTMSNEEKQANEQWLKRIPDDPAGLLRRKFKYQYEQQRQQ
jgi:Ca-activated chloride channel family protein